MTLEERVKALKENGTIPRHVAIIMDGNGRWAKARGLSRVEGHRVGVQSVRAVVEMAGQLGTEVVTLYTFSSENWKRPRSEISALMSLLLNTIKEEVDELDEKNVRLMTIGDLKRLPTAPRLGVKQTIDRLSKNDGLLVNLALSYSGRDELVSAMQDIARQVQDGTLDVDEIDTAAIDQNLQTRGLPEPDLLIRTSGEMRLSNFMLWQLAYTEMYVTRALWPDFREQQFLDAIENFQHRERRYGCVSEQIANANMI